ncbi:SusC/RagA family TonB-linked outer membrane protein [Chitinophaga oryziterrae]|uniref:SusC/RagA family TonB-linked outer membrane protein n=1 Tax=Chitinophaga oryziterrae TaxID=1031224 RepID=A0A6N8JBX6_9BACT|nr:TonB-dependent receptor [Chitinophaga oryziterrae]MVT42693.1 SusC/RagA family TonB-linked outer membrane protein [Chitinophaga oryziterrae]
MRKVLLFATVMLLLLSHYSYSQDRMIKGIIKDAKDNSPLPGVTVKIKGTTSGTVSAADGTYQLPLPNGATTLTYSFIGYADQEIVVGNRTTIDIALGTGNKDLSEVVVVGYGTQVKRELTGSISKINASEIENFPAPSFESALQGKAAGVVIESGSGKLGQGLKIRIRGTSSIGASSQPLYVVDGIPLVSSSQSDANNEPTNPLADINPNDIESVEVLKDASAAAIYGARASNGVVLITTKRGRQGEKTQISLDLSRGFSNPTKKRGFLNARQYVDLLHEAATNDGKTGFAIGDFASEAEGIKYMTDYVDSYMDYYSLGTDWRNAKVNTNWEDQIYHKNAPSSQVNLSASGGNEKTRFFVSGFYSDQDAIIKVNRFRRYGGRLNLDHTASSHLSLGVNLAVNRSQLDRVSDDNAYSTPGQVVAQMPISPLIDSATGKLNNNTLYPSGLYDAQYNFDKQVNFHTIGSAYVNYTFFPSLSFRSEVGTDLYNLTEDEYNGKLSSDGAGIGKGTFVSTQTVSLNTNNYFTFTPNLGKSHKLTATLGMSYLQNDNKGSYLQGENYPSDAVPDLSGAATITGGSTTNVRYTFLSYFLRGNYSFMNKYLFSASVRTDGSSRFGPKNHYGWFPAVSAGWLISEEKFLKGNNVLNYLKLKASYGITGNSEIGNGRYLTQFQVTKYPLNPGYSTDRPGVLGNDSLKWEKTKQFDAGIEFGFLNNRISGEVDYYNKQTSDLLLAANIPYTSGFSTVYRNAGDMENKGVEITLNSRNIDAKDFVWTTTLNLGYNKNRVKNIGGQIFESSGGEQRAVEGQPIGTFYMAKFAGVDPANGDALYYDASGKKTNDYSAAPRMVVGQGNPDWTGGLSNAVSYKGFDLNVLFTFVSGNSIYNRAGIYQAAGFGGGFDNQTHEMLGRWQKAGDVTNIPRLSFYYGNGTAESSRWIYDGSYIRLKTVTLGYTVPKVVTSTLHIASARLYVAGYNLWTKTKYISDPEVNTGSNDNSISNIGSGIDFYTIPQAKTFTVGLNVKF